MTTEPDPRARRIDVSYEGVLVASDGHEIPIVVKDLSREGFRVELHDEVLVGELVRLRVGRGGDLHAEIRWALGTEAGGVFLDRPPVG
jgi:hypothetical protein